MATIKPNYVLKTDPESGNRFRSKTQDGWLLRWKDHNGRWKMKTFRGTRRDAQKFLDSIVVRIDRIVSGLEVPPERSMSLTAAINQYTDHLVRSKHPQDTVDRYLRSYKPFLLFLPRGIKLQSIKRRHIERFRLWRLESCKEPSVDADLRHLKAFFNWSYGMEFIQRSPLTGIKISTKTKPVRFLSHDEEIALLEVVADNPKAFDLVRFYLHSGVRAGEILPPRFEWTNVHQNEIVILGKGNKIRYLGLNNTMKDILESRKHLKSPFPYSYDGVYELIVRKYYAKAGIIGADLHTLRKTAGARLIQKGVDIYRVSKFLGHSSVTVTERHYVDLLKQDYLQIAEIMESGKSDHEMITISQPIPADSSIVINRDQEDLASEMSDEKGVDSPQKTAFIEEDNDVPGPGLEPGSPFRAGDFKSLKPSPPSPIKYSDLGDRGKNAQEIIRKFLDEISEMGD